MNISISSDNIEVTESMKVLAENKVKKLERIWSDIPDDTKTLRVVMNSAPEGSFLVKLEAKVGRESYYTQEPGFELETALVDAISELIRQYRKRKDKRTPDWSENREGKVLTEEDLEELIDEETTE